MESETPLFSDTFNTWNAFSLFGRAWIFFIPTKVTGAQITNEASWIRIKLNENIGWRFKTVQYCINFLCEKNILELQLIIEKNEKEQSLNTCYFQVIDTNSWKFLKNSFWNVNFFLWIFCFVVLWPGYIRADVNFLFKEFSVNCSPWFPPYKTKTQDVKATRHISLMSEFKLCSYFTCAFYSDHDQVLP